MRSNKSRRSRASRLSTRLIAYTALMTALTYVGTLLGFSGGQFYFNLGDSVILICAYLLGPIPAMIAGGLGAFLGDLTVYPATMVYTLVIKAIEGLVAGLLFWAVKKACAKYLATHMTTAMRTYMSNHPLRDVASDGSDIATDDATDDESAAADLIAVPATGDDTDMPKASADIATSQADAQQIADDTIKDGKEKITQNDVYVSKNIDKTAVFAQIKQAKQRVALLAAGLSLPVCIFATALMAVGYFIAQAFIYGTYAAALIALPLDCVQAAISSVVATIVITLFAYKNARA